MTRAKKSQPLPAEAAADASDPAAAYPSDAQAGVDLRIGQWVMYWQFDNQEGLVGVPAQVISRGKTGGWNLNLHKLGVIVSRVGAQHADSPTAGSFTLEK